MQVPNTDQFADLRMCAERIAQERRLELGELSPDEVENLMHELHVHQIELELQNQELRQAQQDLAASRRRYADLYHTAPAGYFTLNITNAVIMEVNRTGADMLDAETGHLVGQSFTDFVMPNDQDSFYLYLRRLAEHSPSVLQSCEIGMTTAQGVELYANLEGAGVENSASSTDQCRLMISDATARRRAEEHQRDLTFEKERVGILQRFIGDASHDLKTPLTTMKVSLAVLRKSSDPIKQQRHLNILEAQAARLERLLDDLLNMTRLDMILEIDPTPFDLNVLILKIIAEQEERAKQKDLATKFLPDTSLPLIVADKDQISRAITALVVNAFNYTPRNGIITIRTYVQARQHIVEVEDTGIGIGEADLPHIFTRFFRADAARNTEKGGMGLGLAIAKKIIEMHQGNIAVKSTLGVGSAFTVVLPSLTVGN